ncbi:Exo_endo_phos domain-containing protein [Gossypium australe]|uniref:Exo_endo_phos domain-containing protein n=1 Tax=Gossypium australe TaxID=47621 RepID=A0A5B6X370_9ROSI|nr:Exo_endo_phos domain-containing protein [Gossypium australe]
MERINKSGEFRNRIDVEANGPRGGLSLGWKEGISVMLRSFSHLHIDVEVNKKDGKNQRKDSWNILRQLKRNCNLPWMVIGDFNEIMGGCLRDDRQIGAFRDVLEECELHDLGFTGQWFTWERGKLPNNNIREILDRRVENVAWWESFPDYMVNHLQHSFSDHCPILIYTREGMRDMTVQEEVPFRFNVDWSME